MKSNLSDSLFERARRSIPGGVNSPVRAFRSVGRNPLFISRASGAKLWDVDGNDFIDYVGSWGPMILGHCHPEVNAAIARAVEGGTSYGAPTEMEVKIAELICELVPSMQMVRMVNSGTEATMSAVRVARAFTGREKIIKFEGCYHGHADSFLVRAGSGALTLGVPDSPGVPAAVAGATLTAQFNDLQSVEELVETYGESIAALIVEPVVGNMGCVPPEPGFLPGLREICTRRGIILIFDEVMTGFRVSIGGAQGLYGVEPDLTTLGKIIGGGLPVGAYGGRKDLMQLVAPSGPVYQAGTLSGNPLAMAAGYQTLTVLRTNKMIYDRLETMTRTLTDEIGMIIRSRGLPLTCNRVGSMFTLFFSPEAVRDFRTATTSDTKRYAVYFNEMLDRGVYLAPSQFEAAFVSAAHTEDGIRRTVDAASDALRRVFP